MRGKPEIHHSDQGVQYAAREYTKLLEEQGIAISNSPAGIQERLRLERRGRTGMPSG